jgi:PAS domain S-box-containing protein
MELDADGTKGRDRPTYEELEAEVTELRSRVEKLEERLRALAGGPAAGFQTGDYIVEAAPIAVGLHVGGRAVYANPACAELFGFEDPADLLGRTVIDMVHIDDQPDLMERISRQREGFEVPLVYRATGVRKDGSTFELVGWSTSVEIPGDRASLAFMAEADSVDRSFE